MATFYFHVKIKQLFREYHGNGAYAYPWEVDFADLLQSWKCHPFIWFSVVPVELCVEMGMDQSTDLLLSQMGVGRQVYGPFAWSLQSGFPGTAHRLHFFLLSIWSMGAFHRPDNPMSRHWLRRQLGRLPSFHLLRQAATTPSLSKLPRHHSMSWKRDHEAFKCWELLPWWHNSGREGEASASKRGHI